MKNESHILFFLFLGIIDSGKEKVWGRGKGKGGIGDSQKIFDSIIFVCFLESFFLLMVIAGKTLSGTW